MICLISGYAGSYQGPRHPAALFPLPRLLKASPAVRIARSLGSSLPSSFEGERVNILGLVGHGAFDRVGLARPLTHCLVLVGRAAVRHWFVIYVRPRSCLVIHRCAPPVSPARRLPRRRPSVLAGSRL
ncbi:protein of unknown function [Paraburkholderia dioscoreae]|uniref:Uncharacterized protein n=1 Tax=Paraburkholderia dioscoreae TaxID=2604047 RepID=A0A5Q4YUP7_9BURK|nr:protein of unknown function [Paraburkholderia dioscoreae]